MNVVGACAVIVLIWGHVEQMQGSNNGQRPSLQLAVPAVARHGVLEQSNRGSVSTKEVSPWSRKRKSDWDHKEGAGQKSRVAASTATALQRLPAPHPMVRTRTGYAIAAHLDFPGADKLLLSRNERFLAVEVNKRGVMVVGIDYQKSCFEKAIMLAWVDRHQLLRAMTFSTDNQALMIAMGKDRAELLPIGYGTHGASPTSLGAFTDIPLGSGSVAIAFTRAGDFVTLTSKALCVWNRAKKEAQAIQFKDAARRIALSRYADRRAIVDASNTLVVRDMEGKLKLKHKLGKHEPSPEKIVLSADGSIAVAQYPNAIGLWDVEKNKFLSTLRTGNPKILFTGALSFDLLMDHIVTGMSDGTVRWWNMISGKEREADRFSTGMLPLSLEVAVCDIVAVGGTKGLHLYKKFM